MDDDHTILRVLQFVSPELAVNTKLVKPGEVTTWKSLLDPKWQGKIVAKDPTISGSGASLICLMYLLFGPDYVKNSTRIEAHHFARSAPAAQFLGERQLRYSGRPGSDAVNQFRQLGYPIEFVFPTDAPDVLSGGSD